jgi:hypothetical protein
LVRYEKAGGSTWGYAVIVSITNTTVAVADVRVDFAATPDASTKFHLGAWSGTTGYPSIGTFYEQRLWGANTTKEPQKLWATQTADFENFTPDDRAASEQVADDDALDYTISADQVNAIRYLSPGEDVLVIGTTGGEWIPSFSSGNNVGVLTPTDITIRRQTTHGSANVQPVRVGQVVLFVQSAGRKIREFGYAFETDGFQAVDMTRLAYHLTVGGINEMAYQEEPDSLVWAVRNDGELLSMTFRREEDVVGWARHIIGGHFFQSFSAVWQVDDSGPTYVDETTDANDADNADWTLFPASEATDDYAAMGYTEPFDRITFDYANGTAGVGGVVIWEYWNGDNWKSLPSVTDNTTSFTVAAADNLHVSWVIPDDWERRAISTSKLLYYVRARVTTVYTTNPVMDQGFVGGKAVVESVAVIGGNNGAGQTQDSSDRDEVWVTVKRTIGGATKRYVEMLERDYEDGDEQEDSYYADSLLTYDSTAATTITGLAHLNGETVAVLADGAVVDSAVVASNQITLSESAAVVQVGLPYTHKLRTLKIEAGAPRGSAVGKIKQIFGFTGVFRYAMTMSFGKDAASLTAVDFRTAGDPTDAAVPYFEGERFYEFDDDWESDARMTIMSSDPAAFMLLALAPEVDTREARG